MGYAESLYRLMVKAYPSRFSERYSEEMVSLFMDQLKDAEAERRVGSLWARTARDWVSSAAAEHAAEFGRRWSMRRPASPPGMVPLRTAIRRTLVFAPSIPVALLLLAGVATYRAIRNSRA
jgi:hypothetical protein